MHLFSVKTLFKYYEVLYNTKLCNERKICLMDLEKLIIYAVIVLITYVEMDSSHMLAKLCSKFSKPGFNSTWTVKFQMFKVGLEKAEEPEIKLSTSVGSSKKQENSRKKKSTSTLLTMPKPLCGSHQTVENSERDGNTRPPDLPPEKFVCRSRSNS